MLKNNLDTKLSQLNHLGKIVFALLCAERQLNCVTGRDEVEGSELRDKLEQCLNSAFAMISDGNNIEKYSIEKYIEKYLMLMPSFEGESEAADLQSIHAVTSMVYALEIMLTDDVSNTAYVSQMTRESVYLKVQSITGKTKKSELEQHESYIKELLKQNLDIEILKQQAVYDKTSISKFREDNRSFQIERIIAS